MIIVSNTSPITNLAAINQLHLLQEIYGDIIIPQAVYQEMANFDEVAGSLEVKTFPWIKTQFVANYNLVNNLENEIDLGESEAIILALELSADRLILDDYKARSIASQYHLNIVGTLGVLLIAKQRKLIISVQSLMDQLIHQAGFRVSQSLYQEILKLANESSYA